MQFFSMICRLTPPYGCKIFPGQMSLCNTSRQTMQVTACQIILFVVFSLDRSRCISQEGQDGFELAFKNKVRFRKVTHVYFNPSLVHDLFEFQSRSKNIFHIVVWFYLQNVITDILWPCIFTKYTTEIASNRQPKYTAMG